MSQLIDTTSYSQSIYRSETLTENVLNELTLEKPIGEKNGLKISTEDVLALWKDATYIVQKQNQNQNRESPEQKPARLAEIRAITRDMERIINKYIVREDPVKTESLVSETNAALSGVQRKTTFAFGNAMRQGNVEEKNKLKKLMLIIHVTYIYH